MRHGAFAAGIAAFFALALPACGKEGEDGTSERARRNVLLISLDTLRADRLGCYGYERDTSPALDAFAAKCVRFAHAIAPSPWTVPSHVSLFTGLLPEAHGVELPDQTPGPGTTLLAETVFRAGWYTFGITDGGFMGTEQGIDRGFRAFYDRNRVFANTVREAQTYIQDRDPLGAWFGFLHTYDIHCPYDPHEPYRSMFVRATSVSADIDGKCGNPWLNEMDLSPAEVDYVSDRYDGGIREVDDALGQLFAYLEESGHLADTIVILVSDHGEEFDEHGRIGHEKSLSRELLEVPFLLYVPGMPPDVVEAPVSLVDVFPTLLELLDLPLPPDLDGTSLLGLLDGTRAPATGQPASLRWQFALDAWWTPEHLLIVDREADAQRLFDLRADPLATNDLSEQDDELCSILLAELSARLTAAARRRQTPGSRAIGADQAQLLQHLGYGGTSKDE